MESTNRWQVGDTGIEFQRTMPLAGGQISNGKSPAFTNLVPF